MMFGNWGGKTRSTTSNRLVFTESIDCCICLCESIADGVKMPRCQHNICLGCFKNIYFPTCYDQPDFPFPDRQKQFDDFDFQYQESHPPHCMFDHFGIINKPPEHHCGMVEQMQ